MAFGFPPKYACDLLLDDLSTEQFLVIALETAKKLNWDIGFTSETGFIAYTKFSMTSWSEEITVKIQGTTANLKSEFRGSQLIDWGRNKKNIEKFIYSFTELKNSLSSAQLYQKFEELKSTLAAKEQDILSQSPATGKEKITDFFSIFRPVQGYFVTPILVDLNILVFILMVAGGVNFFLPDNESLIRWGANYQPVTLNGEWWRLITCTFLHIGIVHLLFNMYALLYIGLLLEPHLGKARFTAAYLLTGLTSSMASLWWHDQSIISAGASGAIFGMYGVFLAMLTTNLIDKAARKSLLTSIAVFVGYNLVNGLKGGIDNAAHIGGLLGGLFIGYAYYPTLKKPSAINIKYGTITMLTVLIVSCSFLVYNRIPNNGGALTGDLGEYHKKMEKFSSMESTALELFQLPKNTSKEKYLSEIKDTGLYYWNENIKLLNGLDSLDLPREILDRNKKLVEYCELRIKSYNLIYKAIDEDTESYSDSIEFYNKKIAAVVNDLKAE